MLESQISEFTELSQDENVSLDVKVVWMYLGT